MIPIQDQSLTPSMNFRYPFPLGFGMGFPCLSPLDTASVNLYLDLQKELDYVEYKVRAFDGKEEEFNICMANCEYLSCAIVCTNMHTTPR